MPRLTLLSIVEKVGNAGRYSSGSMFRNSIRSETKRLLVPCLSVVQLPRIGYECRDRRLGRLGPWLKHVLTRSGLLPACQSTTIPGPDPLEFSSSGCEGSTVPSQEQVSSIDERLHERDKRDGTHCWVQWMS